MAVKETRGGETDYRTKWCTIRLCASPCYLHFNTTIESRTPASNTVTIHIASESQWTCADDVEKLEEVKTEKVQELPMASPQRSGRWRSCREMAKCEYQQWICLVLDAHQSNSISKIRHSRRAWQRRQRVRGHGFMHHGARKWSTRE